MTSTQLKDTYDNRLKTIADNQSSIRKKDNYFSIGRLILFVLMIVITVLLFQWNAIAGLVFIYLAISGFYFLVKNHDSLKTEKDTLESLKVLNEGEMKGLDNDYSAFNDGLRYADDLHPFSMDLDLFGPKSLFQKINRCSSIFGENRLAGLLSEHVSKSEILDLQEANRELEMDIEWRQRLFAIGMKSKKEPKQIKNIIDWANSTEEFYMPKIWMILVPLMTILAFVYFCWSGHFNISWIAFIPTAFLTFKNAKKITALQIDLTKHIALLKTYSSLLNHLEEKKFKAKKLLSLQAKFKSSSSLASKNIKKLSFYLNQLDQRLNIFTAIFNLTFLWDHIWVNKIHDWKKENAHHIESWFNAMGEFEALNSMATLAYNNPGWTYPQIIEKKSINAKEIGHPLIHPSVMISNDFSTSTHQHIKIITGSNMGGKSTFLRTIGINSILAYAGAKVCAKDLSLPFLQFYTSMRTKDDLSDNTSSFYAELKRLKMVLEAVQKSDNIYFLLDEILKGTNTKDRHKGAKALILQLLNHKGAGLISTHDLELGNLEKDHLDQIENLCFEVETKGEELIFDYKIKKGVSKSFNATQLMKNIGIEI